LIPTHSGLAVVHPDRVQMNRVAPGIVIESVVLDNQVLGTGIERYGHPLPPGHRKLEVNFTAPSFIEARANTFRYRLDGWDDTWVDSGNQRKVIYPRLPAGNYHFMVTAANNAGVWNDTGASFSFSVQPFLWQTWWFRTMAALLFTSALFALVRFVSLRRLNLRVAQLEEENALQRERGRIAQDIHDDLGARMTQISMLAERTQKALKDPDKAGEHVSQIAAMSREGMKSLDEIVWAVNPGNDNLPDLLDYAGQYAVDFLAAAGIRCRLDFPDNPPSSEISAELRHSLFMALKEALHNVAKHANASEVHLRASLRDGKLEWLVEDNGRGFDNVPGGPFADGLGNMRRRLASLGGSCSVDGKPGAGTRIRFEVSLKGPL
jgi:signal transduction histidine kinase